MVLKIKNNRIPPYPSIKIGDIIKVLIFKFRKKKEDNLYKLYNSEYLVTYSKSTYSISQIFIFLNKYYKKKNIFIPDYICNEGIDILRGTNANLIFYDHEKISSNKLIEEMEYKNADIFMFVNYFGKRNNLKSGFIDFLKKNNIFIIEDNTHCMKSSQANYSDFEVYSPHKLFGLVDGSIIKFNNKFLHNQFIDFYRGDNISTNNNYIGKYIQFIVFTFKRNIRKIIGYKYPKLNFKFISSPKKNIGKTINPLSIKILEFYYSKIDLFKDKRIKNYYLWKKNLKSILPFVEMEKIDFTPYLGIIKFKNNSKREEILNKYNSYGLPIGNWPDLPKEVTKSEFLHRKAKENFYNQLTIPVHQDIKNNEIINIVNKSFSNYVDSFNLKYFKDEKIIKVYDLNKLVGMIVIVYNPFTEQNILRLKFIKDFYITYLGSKNFFYKFSAEIINKLRIKDEIHMPKEFININKYKQFKYKLIKENIIPLIFNEQKIKDFIYIFLKEIKIKKELNLRKIKIYEFIFSTKKGNNQEVEFKIKNSLKNELISIHSLRRNESHIFLEKLNIIDRSIPICDHLIMLCFYLKKLKFNYLNILEYYNN